LFSTILANRVPKPKFCQAVKPLAYDG